MVKDVLNVVPIWDRSFRSRSFQLLHHGAEAGEGGAAFVQIRKRVLHMTRSVKLVMYPRSRLGQRLRVACLHPSQNVHVDCRQLGIQFLDTGG